MHADVCEFAQCLQHPPEISSLHAPVFNPLSLQEGIGAVRLQGAVGPHLCWDQLNTACRKNQLSPLLPCSWAQVHPGFLSAGKWSMMITTTYLIFSPREAIDLRCKGFVLIDPSWLYFVSVGHCQECVLCRALGSATSQLGQSRAVGLSADPRLRLAALTSSSALGGGRSPLNEILLSNKSCVTQGITALLLALRVRFHTMLNVSSEDLCV
ncbi:uncharacterized protein LOC122169610 [Centrocercus urophasianus]|uniref:uncharacterized protein LOC122169610 n=1 Tax=Centrocercus urophasianus TaxID=9002 RepID=UPI001C651B04|nr:uncharacterized protein LOC122169610 [Centrocercus urophasianus]